MSHLWPWQSASRIIKVKVRVISRSRSHVIASLLTDLPTLTVWPWDSRFGMPTHGHGTTTHGKTKSTNKVKNTLKQIICRCCFYLTYIFEVFRFEVLISRFFWAFFQNLQICMWWRLEGLYWWEAIQSAQTWHDYRDLECPTQLLYNLQLWCQGRWFRKLLYALGQSEKS